MKDSNELTVKEVLEKEFSQDEKECLLEVCESAINKYKVISSKTYATAKKISQLPADDFKQMVFYYVVGHSVENHMNWASFLFNAWKMERKLQS